MLFNTKRNEKIVIWKFKDRAEEQKKNYWQGFWSLSSVQNIASILDCMFPSTIA